MLRIEGHSFIPDLLPAGAQVVDLGANRGRFASELLDRFDCHVLAVEPVPELYSGLPTRLGLATSQHALTYDGLNAQLHLNPNRCASVDLPEDQAVTVAVAGTTLERLLSDHKIDRVQLLKMDIEGAELDVISQSPDNVLLRADQITVEFHDFMDPRLGPAVDLAIARLIGLGYQLFQISYTDRSDLLFVHPRLRISRIRRTALLVRYRWLGGLSRRLRRWVG